jgi:hypothetical protein
MQACMASCDFKQVVLDGILETYGTGRIMTPSAQDIDKGLNRIRRLRRIFLFILFSFIPLTMLIMAYVVRSQNGWAILVPVILFFVGMGIQHHLHRSKCPKCKAFFVQAVTKENYTPLSSISFPPQKKCQNCGLVLYR